MYYNINPFEIDKLINKFNFYADDIKIIHYIGKKPWSLPMSAMVSPFFISFAITLNLSLSFIRSPISTTFDVVPSPVMSSCAVAERAMSAAVGCWICCA